MEKFKILCIIGTRPEAIKFMPVVRQLKNSMKFEPVVLATGQHQELLDQALQEVELKSEINLRVMTDNQSPSSVVTKILHDLTKIITSNNISAILVQGDTATAFAGAFAGFSNKIPVGHIEAGLRTYNLMSPYPEEGLRQMIDRMSKWCFAPTAISETNLLSEHIKKSNIFVTGNTIMDTLRILVPKITNSKSTLAKLGLKIKSKYILITAHRRENQGESFKQVAEAIRELAKMHSELDFIYPVHPNPNVSKQMKLDLNGFGNIHLISPLGYTDFLSLMQDSRLILSDSGGIQEEASYFNIPVVLLRDTTERPEGITSGITYMAGCNKKNIISLVESILLSKKKLFKSSPYGDGYAAKKIIEILGRTL